MHRVTGKFADCFEKWAQDGFQDFARQYQGATKEVGNVLAPAFSPIGMTGSEIGQALRFVAPTGLGLAGGKLLTMPFSRGLSAAGRRLGNRGIPLRVLGAALTGAGMVGGGLAGYHLGQTNIRDFITDMSEGRASVRDVPIVGPAVASQP
jgi:hypothetical protein